MAAESDVNKEISKALRKTSAFRAWLILFFCALVVILAFYVRYFVVSVWEFEGKKIFICQLSFCIDKAKNGDLILAKTPSDEEILLWQQGKSGDSIMLPTVFDSVQIHIPKLGDTLRFADLNPFSWDLAVALYRDQNKWQKTIIHISLESKSGQMPFASVGRASISGRPVSEREVHFLPWQELRLLELQLQRIFPAQDSIHFKRNFFADSSEVLEFINEEELYYLSCEKTPTNKICYDSRERGLFRKSDIIGLSQQEK